MSDTENKESSYADGLSSQEAAAFLRKIADQVEGKSSEEDRTLHGNFKKLKLSLKRESGRISLKIEVKHDDESDSDIEESSGHAKVKKYRAAKKRMKHSFKDICQAVSAGKIPSETLTESFFRDSDIMVSYPRYGEEYYKEYIRACEEFRSALNQKNLESAALLCEKIKKIKSVCHKRYK